MSPSASAGWLWRLLVLALATSRPIRAIQVAPDDGARSPGNSTDQQPADNATLVGDSHLSASERNRRLIPYMAFYLPAPEFPENQQYAVQRPKQQQQHADSAGPLPPPGAIPIPTAYVHMKVPAAATGNDVHFQQHQLLQQQRLPFPPSAGEVYHSISYGGQHPVPAGPKEGAKKTPVLHLLAPGASAPSAPSGPPPSAPASGNKHNAVLVYQPSGAGQLQQPPQKQRQPQPFRQRTKPSKSRLTPFTAANTVPGHFIPIIYTSLAPTNDGDNTSGPGPSTAIHYNGEEASADEQQQPQPQQPDYALPPSAPTSPGQSSHPGQHQVQFLAVTAGPSPAPAARPTSSPIYHVINEASEPLLPSPHQPHQQLHKHQQQQQQTQLQQSPPSTLKQHHRHHPHHAHAKHPNFHPPKPENFFDTEHYLGADNMTPQQKYVLYLQQRLRHNKQQQKHRERAKDRQRQQYYKQQQQHLADPPPPPPQIFVISSTAAPAEQIGGGFVEVLHPSQPPQHGYPQHSPIRHAVYPRPELPVPANHQPHHPAPQVVHIPARPAAADALAEQPHHPGTNVGPPHRPQTAAHYPKSGSAPQYIDYVIDEPRQSLDEEQQHRQQLQQAHQQHQPLATPQPTHAPPQAAFIVITTASPHPPDPPARTHFGSTPSPLYMNQPTVRLRPIAHYTTPSPNYPTRLPAAVHPTHSPDHQPSASPQYVYQTQASYSPTPTSKSKPAYDYEEHFAKPSKRPPPPSPTPAPTAAPTHVEPYRPPVEVQVQIQPASHYPQTQPQPRPQHPQPQPQPLPAEADPNQLPDIRSSSLADILHKLQASNHLPQTLTPDNIDNSIKTLITILNNLKQSQTIVANPPQHHETPHPGAATDYDYTNGSEEDHRQDDLAVLSPIAPTKRPGPNTGRPGVDYPNYAEIPETSFNCGEQRYKGFFGDPETNCQVWHYCDLNGGKASFLCPNGTIFSQIALTCDWWFNVKCSTTSQLYVLNERLYKYILPFTPKFPEDYSGPIVDKYLALKFQEMEEKMRLEKHKTMEQPANTGQEPKTEEVDVTTVTQTAEIHSVNSQVGEQSSERNLLIDDEVNDISQRGSVDPYGSTTPSTPTTSLAAEMPLSLKPIVVSSTAEPNYEKSSEEQSYQGHTTQDIPTPYADQSNAPYSMQHQMPATREATKISVEKVEVIEIKTDGTSGHLTPEMIFNNEAKKR